MKPFSFRRASDADEAVSDLAAGRGKLQTQPSAAVVEHGVADGRADDYQNQEIADHVRSPFRSRTSDESHWPF